MPSTGCHDINLVSGLRSNHSVFLDPWGGLHGSMKNVGTVHFLLGVGRVQWINEKCWHCARPTRGGEGSMDQ